MSHCMAEVLSHDDLQKRQVSLESMGLELLCEYTSFPDDWDFWERLGLLTLPFLPLFFNWNELDDPFTESSSSSLSSDRLRLRVAMSLEHSLLEGWMNDSSIRYSSVTATRWLVGDWSRVNQWNHTQVQSSTIRPLILRILETITLITSPQLSEDP